MKDQFLEPNSGKYLTIYRAVDDASPGYKLGSSITEYFEIQAVYASGAQTVARIDFLETSSNATIWRFVIGTAAGDDWTVYDGTNDILLIEGDTTRMTFRLDGGANSDFVITDAGTDVLRIQSDLVSMTFTGDGTTGSDFEVADAASNILLIETDTRKVTFVIGTDSGDDFIVNDGTIDMLLLEPDTAAFTWRGDASTGSDFTIHDGTNPILTIGTDSNDSTYKAGHQILCPDAGLQILNASTDKLSFYDIATPVAQPLKSNFNSWTAASDIAGALAALGLVDAA